MSSNVLALRNVRRPFAGSFKPNLEILEDRRLLAPIAARLIDIGTLGGDVSVPYTINQLGQVAGYSNLVKGGKMHAFIWDAQRGMRDLGVLPGGTISGAYGINDIGQVVGVSTSSMGTRAFVWDEVNGMQDLGTPWEGPGGRCNAWDINDLGQIVGSCVFPEDQEIEHTHAVIWQGGNELTLIPNQWGTAFSYAYGINNNGDIVGWATGDNTEPHAYLLKGGIEGEMINLGTLGGPNSKAYRLGLDQQIVGASSQGGRYDKAFYWDDGEIKSIPTLGGAFNYAYGVNDAGMVVGKSYTSPPNIHAYVYWNDEVVDLNDYVEPTSISGWRALTEARDINNNNQVVGWGRRWKESHAFVMTLRWDTPPPGALNTAFGPSVTSVSTLTPRSTAPGNNTSAGTPAPVVEMPRTLLATQKPSVTTVRALSRPASATTLVLQLDVFA